MFCEVKTRIVRAVDERPGAANPLGPFASIGSRKQRQVRAMAREWLAQGLLEGARPPEIRFDAIGISFDARGRLLSLEHLEAAFLRRGLALQRQLRVGDRLERHPVER